MSSVAGYVRLLAEQYPNAIYRPAKKGEACSNIRGHVENGPQTEGCIVGQAIRMSGNCHLISEMYTDSQYTPVNMFTKNQFDALEVKFLHLVQFYQDYEETWENAVKLADKEMNKLA